MPGKYDDEQRAKNSRRKKRGIVERKRERREKRGEESRKDVEMTRIEDVKASTR